MYTTEAIEFRKIKFKIENMLNPPIRPGQHQNNFFSMQGGLLLRGSSI